MPEAPEVSSEAPIDTAPSVPPATETSASAPEAENAMKDLWKKRLQISSDDIKMNEMFGRHLRIDDIR